MVGREGTRSIRGFVNSRTADFTVSTCLVSLLRPPGSSSHQRIQTDRHIAEKLHTNSSCSSCDRMCLIQLITSALPSISCYRYWTCFHQNVQSPTQSLPSLSTSSWGWTRQSSTNSEGISSFSLAHIISSPLPLDKYPKWTPSSTSAD